MISYPIVDGLSFDGYNSRKPEAGWKPSLDQALPLGKRLPFDWEPPFYEAQWPGRFSSTAVYNNLIAISNFAKDHPTSMQACLALCKEVEQVCLDNSIVADDCRFSMQRYAFDSDGFYMAPCWVNGIDTGFVIRGLARVQDIMPNESTKKLLDEYACSYTVLNTSAKRLLRPWFSYVDDAGYLWFEEKPTDDSRPTHVLNGHIHAMLGLYYYRRHASPRWVDPFIRAAITTVRDNVHRYRVAGNVNRYDLLQGYKADYAPNRTVRQQRELARITGDGFFRGMAEVFEDDHTEAFRSAGGKKIPIGRRSKAPFGSADRGLPRRTSDEDLRPPRLSLAQKIVRKTLWVFLGK